MFITKHRFVALFLLLLTIAVLLPLSVDGLTINQLAPINKPIPDGAAENVANCRYGVTTENGTDLVDWVDDFGAGWYLDFLFYSPPASNGAEYVGVIYVEQDKDGAGNYLPSVTVTPPLTEGGLGPVIDRNPGRLWIIGNEVDRGPNPDGGLGQGDTFPEPYARAYHDAYQFIKGRDPTALVAISGLVEVTPGRLQYLDLVWQAYDDLYQTTMPVDVWNMHLYILPEVTPGGQPNGVANVALGTDPALGIRESGGFSDRCELSDVYCVSEHDSITAFEEQVVAMRSWMRDHGQQQKPLIISEYSILYPYYGSNNQPCALKDEDGKCFDLHRVAMFMGETFNYLEQAIDPDLGYSLDNDRLVQQWLWYSIYRPGLGHASNLITRGKPAQLTPAGQLFQQTTFSSMHHVNLLPGLVNNPIVPVSSVGSTITATLTLAVFNNGTQRLDVPFQVAFYRDPDLKDQIGVATVPGPENNGPGMTGCAIRHINATVEWPDLPVGQHAFWVKIDYLDQIEESDKSDNVTSGTVTVNPFGSFLPALTRS